MHLFHSRPEAQTRSCTKREITMNTHTHILLLEDDESLRRSISFKLSREGYTVHEAPDLKTAKSLCPEHTISLVICDINLPDGSGLDFCAELRRKSDILILFLTALDAETDMIKGYDAGADDYITKPFSLTVLISKVNAMIKRHVPGKAETVIRSGSIELLSHENRTKKDGRYLTLTANEQKLLSCFMHNPLHILSKNQLLAAVWDIDGNFVDENTLAVNIRRLREKIEDDPSNPVFLKNVRGLGYIWEKSCETGEVK